MPAYNPDLDELEDSDTTTLDDDAADEAENLFDDEDIGPAPAEAGLLDETTTDDSMTQMVADTEQCNSSGDDDTLDGYDAFSDAYNGESESKSFDATDTATSEAGSSAAPSAAG